MRKNSGHVSIFVWRREPQLTAIRFFALCGVVAAVGMVSAALFFSTVSTNKALAQKSCDIDEKWCCKKTSDGNVLCNCEASCP